LFLFPAAAILSAPPSQKADPLSASVGGPSRWEPMKKIARSLREHRELILNYFRAQKLPSSGGVEGPNNKAKVSMRKSYGYPTSPPVPYSVFCRQLLT
jgi:transposase